MSNLGHRAQALVDRLARMDPARPRQDRAAVERAIRAYLRRLGLRRRRILWMQDARSAVGYIAAQVCTDGLTSAAMNYFDFGWAVVRFLLLIVVGTLGLFVAFLPLPTFASWLSGDRLGIFLRDHISPPTIPSVIVAVVLIAGFYWGLISLFARNMRRRLACADQIEAILKLRDRHWDLAERAALGTELPVLSGANIWGNIRNSLPFNAHAQAYREVFTRSWWDFTGSQACPMTEAFEAGLFLYWIRPFEVVCVPHPVLHIVGGELRGVEWATGESYRYDPNHVWPDSKHLE